MKLRLFRLRFIRGHCDASIVAVIMIIRDYG